MLVGVGVVLKHFKAAAADGAARARDVSVDVTKCANETVLGRSWTEKRRNSFFIQDEKGKTTLPCLSHIERHDSTHSKQIIIVAD